METFDVVQEFPIVAEGSRGGEKRQALKKLHSYTNTFSSLNSILTSNRF
jgi:hypothetical protein